MRIGFCYDLRDHYLAKGYSIEETAEFDFPETIEAIDNALTSLGFKVDHIGHLESLCQRLLKGDSWPLVFNMAEGMYGAGREAQIPALLDAWQINYTFSDTTVNAITLNKVVTKRLLRDHGLPTANFELIEKPEDIAKTKLELPIMAKPLREGNSKGISPDSKIESPQALNKQCHYLLKQFKQPVLLEEFLPGREFTVGILGTGEQTQCVGVLEKLLGDEPVYFKYDVGFPGVLVDDKQAQQARKIAIKAWQVLECRDGGRVDIRCDTNGKPVILEVNTVPGLRPNNSDLPVMCELAGINFTQLIKTIVESAQQRQCQ